MPLKEWHVRAVHVGTVGEVVEVAVVEQHVVKIAVGTLTGRMEEM